jgi:hypothetical protein
LSSEISRIIGAYKDALDESQERYEGLYRERAKSAIKFYGDFFNGLVKQYHTMVTDPAGKRQVMRIFERMFATTDVRFAAIDGTLYKDTLEDYMVFFGASYAVRGDVSLLGNPPVIHYEKWSSEQDVSMVAYVPIPFAELGDLAEEQFLTSDKDKQDLSGIHFQIMQLAEVFLLFDLASNATIRPHYILWDQSMSSVLASNEPGYNNVGLVGYEFMGREVTQQDVVISFSRPYSKILGIPSAKSFRRYNFVLSRLSDAPVQKLSTLAVEAFVSKDDLLKSLRSLVLSRLDQKDPIASYDQARDEIRLNSKYVPSWEHSVGLFIHICKRLFKDKDPKALTYEKIGDDGQSRTVWMSRSDLQYLIAIGLRAAIEVCWKHRIMLVGIVKDSASRHLSRNYLGVMRHVGQYQFANTLLPWTDRTFLEALPVGDDTLLAPWTTIEFDSVFMTMHAQRYDNNGQQAVEIRGYHGDVLTTERLFARSLGQFFLSRAKGTPSMGHVIFVDRLMMPDFDPRTWKEMSVQNNEIGNVKPFVFKDKLSDNPAQDANVFLLYTLTRNLYPEVIGYPDPLHKADWGAKSLEKRVAEIIRSSSIAILSKPLRRTFRDIRDSVRRT